MELPTTTPFINEGCGDISWCSSSFCWPRDLFEIMYLNLFNALLLTYKNLISYNDYDLQVIKWLNEQIIELYWTVRDFQDEKAQ